MIQDGWAKVTGRGALGSAEESLQTAGKNTLRSGGTSLGSVMLTCCVVDRWRYLVRAWHIRGNHLCHRPDLLLRPTLQHGHLCSQTEACRRETCASAHRQRVLCLDCATMADFGERHGSPRRHGCRHLHTDHANVQEHISHRRRSRDRHTPAYLLDEEFGQGSPPEVVSEAHACECLGPAHLGAYCAWIFV